MTTGKVLFVTGRFAEPALRETVAEMEAGFASEVAVMKITVAALMTPDWIARFLEPPEGVDLILLPGLCRGDVEPLEEATGLRVEKGPDDLRRIPQYFGLAEARRDYGDHDIQILAEVNNAGERPRDEVLAEARHYRDSGADVIDVGCTPGRAFPGLGELVEELRAGDMRVSVDSFDEGEIRTAVEHGAEMVLSVNSENLEVARDLEATVVAIPDFDGPLSSLDPTIEKLEAWGTPYVVDAVIDPIGFGFAESLGRFVTARERYPEAEMLMGIGNLSELTDADTTGVNALLVGFCQELDIRHVLTTEVIPWARGAVREVDVARRLMHFAVTRGRLPKHLDDRLLTVKDADPIWRTEEELRELQEEITDPNFRIFTDDERIYVFNRDLFLSGLDIQEIFGRLGVEDPSHAFYLGKELQKARHAVHLGKTYRQEGELDFGYLTLPEEATGEVELTYSSRQSREAADGAPPENGNDGEASRSGGAGAAGRGAPDEGEDGEGG